MDLFNGYNAGNVNLNPIPNFNHPYAPMIMVGYTWALVNNLIVHINVNELYGDPAMNRRSRLLDNMYHIDQEI